MLLNIIDLEKVKVEDIMIPHHELVIADIDHEEELFDQFKRIEHNRLLIFQGSENNIIGTYNLALQAIDHRIQSFVMISTDKAVRPSNVMGASKRIAELYIQGINHQLKGKNTNFVIKIWKGTEEKLIIEK